MRIAKILLLCTGFFFAEFATIIITIVFIIIIVVDFTIIAVVDRLVDFY